MSATVTPIRSLEQRMSALDRANEIRTYCARLKGEVSSLDTQTGLRVVAGLVERPPERVESMKLEALLLSVSRWGSVKVGGWMRGWEVSPRKTLGGMSPRQRAELLSLLGGACPYPSVRAAAGVPVERAA